MVNAIKSEEMLLKCRSRFVNTRRTRGHNLWSASIPYLNQVDFSVWEILKGTVARKVFAAVDDLKADLEKE
uniref:Uncharacterized protein n=1 Tax=Caenorhabditis japonica TaxID=281687 RepID=A0A8R1IJN1_CAEJA